MVSMSDQPPFAFWVANNSRKALWVASFCLPPHVSATRRQTRSSLPLAFVFRIQARALSIGGGVGRLIGRVRCIELQRAHGDRRLPDVVRTNRRPRVGSEVGPLTVGRL